MKLVDIPQGELIKMLLTSDQALATNTLHFVVDIGASNARFGFVGRMSKDATIYFYKKPVKSTKKLIQALEELASELGPSTCKRIEAAALNIPGPTNGLVGGPIANYSGTNEEKMVRVADFPRELFPQGATMLMNDLEAGAYGVLAASKYDFFTELFDKMFCPKNGGVCRNREKIKSLEAGHIVVIAPGTGLGNAMIQYHPFSNSFTVLPLEFGHTSVQSRTNKEFLQGYEKILKRGDHEVEYDDLVSGRGLERMYEFVQRKAGVAESKIGGVGAGDIAAKSKTGDAHACKAMTMFYHFMMRFASQLSMGFVPKYVVIVGDNVVKNDFWFTLDNLTLMRKQYLAHSMERYGFMSRVTMLRQTVSANLNLIGCAYVTQLEQQAAQQSNL